MTEHEPQRNANPVDPHQAIRELERWLYDGGDEREMSEVTRGRQLPQDWKDRTTVAAIINYAMKRDEDGKEILLYYLGSNESCAMAYACCMEDKKSEIKAIAEDEVKVIAIPHDTLDEWLIKYTSWKSYIFGSFTQRFNELLRSFENVAFKKLDERLVDYLKEKARLGGKNSIQLSHSKIAEELGSSRVVISRLLKQLENEKKLLLYRNEIKLLSELF